MENVSQIFDKRLDLKLYVLPGNLLGQEFRDVYEKAYLCWKEIWKDVFDHEMKLHKQVYSDEFTRQDQIVALFSGDKCVGMAFVRFCDFGLLPMREDSYFRYWPPETLKTLQKRTSNVAVASCFTVAPEFRQMKTGISMKTLVLSLFLQNFNHSPADIMVTAARRVKSNEKLCSKLGSKTVATQIPYLVDGKPIEHELADLIFWEKGVLDLQDPHLEALSRNLWKNRISYFENRKFIREVKNAA